MWSRSLQVTVYGFSEDSDNVIEKTLAKQIAAKL
jgi:hypothetical protein